MDLAVVLLDDAHLAEEVLDVLSLVARQLDHFAVFGMLDDRSIAVVLLRCTHSLINYNVYHYLRNNNHEMILPTGCQEIGVEETRDPREAFGRKKVFHNVEILLIENEVGGI